MSDDDSSDSSPRRRNRSRRLQANFPLSFASLGSSQLIREYDSITRQFDRIARDLSAPVPQYSDGFGGILAASTSRRRPFSNGASTAPVTSQANNGQAQQMQVMSGASNNTTEKKKFIGPAVTLVSTIPASTYKDQDDTKGTAKTLSYLKVQGAVLEYLKTRAADTLTLKQARSWTQAIDPTINKEPKA